MFTEDGSAVRDDETRPASLSPAFACLGCHNDDPDDGIPDKTIEAAAAGAMGMHEATNIDLKDDLTLGIYPNPTTGPARISISLAEASPVSLKIYNSSGQLIYANASKVYPQGNHVIQWDGKSNTGNAIESGYYFVKVSAGSKTLVDKLVLMK
jgi:flagellar hook assembly protein FlgD